MVTFKEKREASETGEAGSRARRGCSALESGAKESAGPLDKPGAFWSTGEEQVKNGEIGNKITPELRVDWGLILVIHQLDPRFLEEIFIQVFV